MSDDVVIRAEGLGKKYLIGHQNLERVPTLRDAIGRNVGKFARTLRDMAGGKEIIAGDDIEEFWALKDLSFEIKRGDVVGIIGRNGAGKSTLLKVLSRITEPTEGRVKIKGRVASLLEVGTGFHPELTGRENIFLNGAILGMGRAEIRRKFDEIVDFSGVEKFLDTPVKRYSSGMYVRLAFAVAAHLEPEILVVDEVLAVGDAEFQEKCLGKMQDVAGAGRTVLFVSHNIGMIGQLCRSGIHLDKGRIINAGTIKGCIQGMFGRGEQPNRLTFAPGRERPAFTRIEYDPAELKRGRLTIELDVDVPAHHQRRLYAGIILRSSSGIAVWGSSNQIHPGRLTAPAQAGTFVCETPTLPLSAGQYLLSAWLTSDDDTYERQIDAIDLYFDHNPLQPSRPAGEVMGFLEVEPEWSFRPDPAGGLSQ